MARLEADNQLQACVTNMGQPKVANLMKVGVRIGGSAYLPTSFRWGYGWPYPSAYREHAEEELLQINALKPDKTQLLFY